MRVAFVIIPDFVFEAHRRDGGPLSRLDDEQLARVVLVEGEGGRATIRAAAPDLRAEGVQSGMTVARARGQVGHVWALAYDADRAARESARLAGVLLGASPQVRVVGDGVFWVGADGCRLLGGEPGLVDLIGTLVRRSGQAAPLIGVADSVIAARAAAIHGLGIVPAGGDAKALVPLPLSVLPLEEAAREALWALGIHSVGAFTALPPRQIAARFGADAVEAHRLARGEDARTVPVLSSPEPAVIDVDFEAPHAVAEPALFVLRGGLERLIAPHRARGFGVSALTIELALIDGLWERVVRPADPMVDADRLLDMCRALLQDAELPSMMTGLRAEVTEVAPARARQEGLWRHRRRRTVTLDYVLTRLQGRLGPDAVVTPGVVVDTPLPELAATWADVCLRPSRADGSLLGGSELDEPPLAAWRLRRPPDRVELHERHGQPERAELGGRWESFRCVAGPQRISGGSSRQGGPGRQGGGGDGLGLGVVDDVIQRDYWYAELSSGAAVSIYKELGSGQWFWQATLD